MARNFSLEKAHAAVTRGGTRFWLLVAGSVLLVANCVALIFYLAPPGGSRAELQQRREQLRSEIAGTRTASARLRNVSGKVQLGSTEADVFENRYFLPERIAYSSVIAELQRMAKATSVDEREAVFSKEPIEGSDDLSVLNISARFQGSYANLMHFLNEADKSPMLLMLDTLQATPQQRGGQIDTEIRFQVIIREQPGIQLGVQP